CRLQDQTVRGEGCVATAEKELAVSPFERQKTRISSPAVVGCDALVSLPERVTRKRVPDIAVVPGIIAVIRVDPFSLESLMERLAELLHVTICHDELVDRHAEPFDVDRAIGAREDAFSLAAKNKASCEREPSRLGQVARDARHELGAVGRAKQEMKNLQTFVEHALAVRQKQRVQFVEAVAVVVDKKASVFELEPEARSPCVREAHSIQPGRRNLLE